MRTLFLASVSLLSLTVASQALAKAEDAAFSRNDKPIYDSEGKCVRTMWQGDKDPCAPADVVVKAPAPAPVVVVTAPPVVNEEQRTVYFDFNKSTLTAAGTQKLDQLADIINKSTAVFDVVIHGYTDQIGSNSYNDALAQKRAHSVKAYLDNKSRLKSIEGDIRGLGKAPTDGKCASVKKRAAKIDCMSTQRRVEVEFKAQQPQ